MIAARWSMSRKTVLPSRKWQVVNLLYNDVGQVVNLPCVVTAPGAVRCRNRGSLAGFGTYSRVGRRPRPRPPCGR